MDRNFLSSQNGREEVLRERMSKTATASADYELKNVMCLKQA